MKMKMCEEKLWWGDEKTNDWEYERTSKPMSKSMFGGKGWKIATATVECVGMCDTTLIILL